MLWHVHLTGDATAAAAAAISACNVLACNVVRQGGGQTGVKEGEGGIVGGMRHLLRIGGFCSGGVISAEAVNIDGAESAAVASGVAHHTRESSVSHKSCDSSATNASTSSHWRSSGAV